MLNEALGQYEAAALMAVHFTRPSRMARKGEITAHGLRDHETRRFSFFERRQCEDNWCRYALPRPGRPRKGLALRHHILELLSDPLRPRIEVSDAIGTHEAAEILGCGPSFVPRLAQSREIVGRRFISFRGGPSRLWIFSRRSCIENAERHAHLIAAGVRCGRPRSRMPSSTHSAWPYFLLRILDSYRDAPLANHNKRGNTDPLKPRRPLPIFDTPNSQATDRSDDPYSENDDPYWYSHLYATSAPTSAT
jgi:hypothetical protein